MKKSLLWVLASLIMIAAVIYQRTTGPTYPFRGSYESNDEVYTYRLLRSQETTKRARIALPDPSANKFAAQLYFKRYKTDDSLTVSVFEKENNEWAAYLPVQPAAGKMEYWISSSIDGKTLRIPAEGQENIILRYKDPVPGAVLWPHVIMMFFSILIGMYAGLSAIFGLDDTRKWTLLTLLGMTVGGMILGPFVQKYAFGEYWTGWPFGYDLTDNKTLIMWLAWVIAAAFISTKYVTKDALRRGIVILAAAVMTVVYLIPHSMRGSELDYQKVDQGINPIEAIKAGD